MIPLNTQGFTLGIEIDITQPATVARAFAGARSDGLDVLINVVGGDIRRRGHPGDAQTIVRRSGRWPTGQHGGSWRVATTTDSSVTAGKTRVV